MSDFNAESDVTGVLEAVSRGLHNKDAAAIVAQYTPDALLFDLAPPLAHRIDKSELAQWLNTWDGPVSQQLRDMKIIVHGDLAVAYGFLHVSARTKSGEDAAWWMRATACLSRQNGRWKIVHEHTSVPFYMDGSFRVALDLTP
jgi:ketosteroid isomerase-like protein